jgi:hypothetical protein
MLRNWCSQCIRIILALIVVFMSVGLSPMPRGSINTAVAQGTGLGSEAPNAIEEDSLAFEDTRQHHVFFDEDGKVVFYDAQGNPIGPASAVSSI